MAKSYSSGLAEIKAPGVENLGTGSDSCLVMAGEMETLEKNAI